MGQCLIINVREIQLQTFFYPGYSKQNITSVQAPVLGKKNLLADKSDNNVLHRIASQNLATGVVQYGLDRRQDQWEGNNYSLSF